MVTAGSACNVTVAFQDGTGTAIVPTTLVYRIDCEHGGPILPTTSLTPAGTVTITVPGTLNRMHSQDPWELHTLTATAVYSGQTYTSVVSWKILAAADGASTAQTWNAVERIVLDLIGEDPDSPDAFQLTPAGMAPVRDSVNYAIQELCSQTGSYVRTFPLLTLASRPHYRINPRHDCFGYFLEVWDRSNKRRLVQTSVQRLAREDPQFLQRSGTPTHYYHLGQDVVGLYPYPTVTGAVLEGRAVMIPGDVEDGRDPVRLRHTWHRAAAALAVSEFYASRGDAGKATEALQDYVSLAQLKIGQPKLGMTDADVSGQRHPN